MANNQDTAVVATVTSVIKDIDRRRKPLLKRVNRGGAAESIIDKLIALNIVRGKLEVIGTEYANR